MATFVRDKNIITITFADGENYRYDINYGQIYGKKGKPIKTMPKKVKDAFVRRYCHYNYGFEKDIIWVIGYKYNYGWHNTISIAFFDKLLNMGITFNKGIPANLEDNISKDWKLFKQFLKTTDNFEACEISRNFYNYCQDIEKEKLEQRYKIKNNPRLSEMAKTFFYRHYKLYNEEERLAAIYYLERGAFEFFESVYSLEDQFSKFFKYCALLNIKIPKEKDFFNAYLTVYKNYTVNKDFLDEKALEFFQNKRNLHFETKDFIIIVPITKEEFREEGNNQHNCVFTSYCNAVLNGQTNVVFIRKKDDVTKSYITCEISKEGQIRQYLKAYNRSINSNETDAIEFRTLYQQYLDTVFKEGV